MNTSRLSDEYLQIGGDIIGAAFRVRKEAKSGFRECYYRDALSYELQQAGYNVETEALVPALYKGVKIADAYKADIIVDESVIIEVKALKFIGESEFRQLTTYLGLLGYKLGYVINFGVDDFKTANLRTDPHPHRYGIYRIVNGI